MYEILGPQNSGTNLLAKVFSNDNSSHRRLWKHTHDFDKLEKYVKTNKQLKFIVARRDIYTWLKSMRKFSYETKWDGKIESRIIAPNDASNGTGHGYDYESIVHLYVKIYNNYAKLDKEYPGRFFFVDYYRIIDVEGYGYYKQICVDLGKPLKDKTQFDRILARPAKTHGKSVKNSKEALLKRKQTLPQQEIDRIKSLLSSIVTKKSK